VPSEISSGLTCRVSADVRPAGRSFVRVAPGRAPRPALVRLVVVHYVPAPPRGPCPRPAQTPFPGRGAGSPRGFHRSDGAAAAEVVGSSLPNPGGTPSGAGFRGGAPGLREECPHKRHREDPRMTGRSGTQRARRLGLRVYPHVPAGRFLPSPSTHPLGSGPGRWRVRGVVCPQCAHDRRRRVGRARRPPLVPSRARRHAASGGDSMDAGAASSR
jgi:hypothetical protein